MIFSTRVVLLSLFCSVAEVIASMHLKFDLVKRLVDGVELEKRQLNASLTQDVSKVVGGPNV